MKSSKSIIVTSVFLSLLIVAVSCSPKIVSMGKESLLEIRESGENSLRITLRPKDVNFSLLQTPLLAKRGYGKPGMKISSLTRPVSGSVGSFNVEVSPDPLTVTVKDKKDEVVQRITFLPDGRVSFMVDDKPVLGMGEGGPRMGRDWKNEQIEFDRRGRLHEMVPRWQSNAYGSRNPVAFLIGTSGWGIYMPSPWVQVDLRDAQTGYFIPWEPPVLRSDSADHRREYVRLVQGRPPVDNIIKGLYDLFVFDGDEPGKLLKDVSLVAGPAVLPPKYSMGYMQSHRTLEDESQMIDIVKTFREKRIPIDAVIYLGTGFCPRGWNKEQPSFEFNPEVFSRAPEEVIKDLHDLNVKVITHIVPWDRDSLPTLQGSIPPGKGDALDEGHLLIYWNQHLDLVRTGIDAWWPDEGDWFNLHERINRHRLYYEGPVHTQPDIRPWSLHRNGHLGVAQWGGWVWSGDTESSWKTLEGQIAVGINHSLSLSPFWGSDIGGFYPRNERTGEMYARWFQFGAFCPSFRSHGRTWWTILPWGWGLSEMGPREDNNRNVPARDTEMFNPSPKELNNPAIEPVCKKYAELRYQLLSYNYTLAWEARQTGLPMMRAMWIHYPGDMKALGKGDQYLWGRDMLIAPVYMPGARQRVVYLPEGKWYDWFTNTLIEGGRDYTRSVDLETMPIFVRAGSVIPMDPLRQYVSEEVEEDLTFRIYTGADGEYTLYEDDGISNDYLRDTGYNIIRLQWDDASRTFTVDPSAMKMNGNAQQTFKVITLPDGKTYEFLFDGKPVKQVLD
ncbi:MAG: TIM-barrel domain-containing protein [Bacteroidales bacterium]